MAVKIGLPSESPHQFHFALNIHAVKNGKRSKSVVNSAQYVIPTCINISTYTNLNTARFNKHRAMQTVYV